MHNGLKGNVPNFTHKTPMKFTMGLDNINVV